MTLEEDPPIRRRYRNVKTVDLYQMDDTGWSALYRPLPEEASSNTAELTLALTLEQPTCELNVQTSHVEFSPIPLNESTAQYRTYRSSGQQAYYAGVVRLCEISQSWPHPGH